MLHHELLEQTHRLALRIAGIELFQRHNEILERRAHRVGVFGDDAYREFLRTVEQGDGAAQRRFVSMITTNFTGFFRHPQHFDLAAEHALYAVHRRGTAHLWSAAASTGEEPYSLAMSLCEVFRRETVPATVDATDIDEDALESGQRGVYNLRTLEPAWSARYFERDVSPLQVRVSDTARRLIRFRALNLTDTEWSLSQTYDVVFCRNVLMYLHPEHRYAVLERIVSVMARDGVLFLDPSEHLGRAAHWFESGTRGMYALRKRTVRKQYLTGA
jgi:chemotaxis protein methyltransferase CheR